MMGTFMNAHIFDEMEKAAKQAKLNELAFEKFSAGTHDLPSIAFDIPVGTPMALDKKSGKVRPARAGDKPFYIQQEERMRRRRR